MPRLGTFLQNHKVLKVTFLILLVFCVIELGSGAVIFASYHILGSPKRISHFRFHPLWTGEDISNYAHLWNEPHPVYGYQLRPNVSNECGLTTDRHGFIHNGDSSREITREAFTIFLVGGSTVAGHGSSCNDQTISAHLERILSEKLPGVMVINAGVAGYYSPIEFLKVADDIMSYDPEVVISLSGTNDFRHEPVGLPGRDPQYFLIPYHLKLMKVLEDTSDLGWSAQNFLLNLLKPVDRLYSTFLVKNAIRAASGRRVLSKSSSDLLTTVRSGFGIKDVTESDLADIREDGFEDKMDQNLAPYTYYIESTESIVRTAGAQYYFLLQPILFTESRQLSEEEKLALEIARVGLYRNYGTDTYRRALYFWGEADKRLRGSLQNYHDFRDVFEDGGDVYSDHIHYTDAGNRIIAERIADILIENGALAETELISKVH